MYRPECQPVTQKTIDEAVDWLWTLDRTKPVGQVSCCEAVLKAIDDPQVCDVKIYNTCLKSKLLVTRWNGIAKLGTPNAESKLAIQNDS